MRLRYLLLATLSLTCAWHIAEAAAETTLWSTMLEEEGADHCTPLMEVRLVLGEEEMALVTRSTQRTGCEPAAAVVRRYEVHDLFFEEGTKVYEAGDLDGWFTLYDDRWTLGETDVWAEAGHGDAWASYLAQSVRDPNLSPSGDRVHRVEVTLAWEHQMPALLGMLYPLQVQEGTVLVEEGGLRYRFSVASDLASEVVRLWLGRDAAVETVVVAP